MANRSTQVISGARLGFLFNGKIVAYANEVSGGEEIRHDEIDVLDDIVVKEHVPVAYRVSLSAVIWRTVADGPATTEAPGSLKEMSLFPKVEEILRTVGLPAILVDSITGKTIAMFENVKASGNRWSVPAKGTVRQNVEFVARRQRDESEVKPVRTP